MVADGLAIAIGRFLGTRLPERLFRYGAAMGFAVFGGILIIGAITG